MNAIGNLKFTLCMCKCNTSGGYINNLCVSGAGITKAGGRGARLNGESEESRASGTCVSIASAEIGIGSLGGCAVSRAETQPRGVNNGAKTREQQHRGAG